MSAEHVQKPRVYANAIICDSVLQDKSTNLLTAIRIANGWSVSPYRFTPRLPDGSADEQNAQLFYPPFSIRLITLFHSEKQTKFTVTFRAITPTGRVMDISKGSISCEIPVDGETYTLNVKGNITTQESGLYWFEVYVDGELATRVPLQVTLQAVDFGQDSDEELGLESDLPPNPPK